MIIGKVYEYGKIVLPLSALFNSFIVYRYLNWNIFSVQALAFTLTMTLCITFLEYPLRGRHSTRHLLDYTLSLLGLTSGLYLTFFYQVIFDEAGSPSAATLVLGTSLIVLIIEAVRRVYGKFLMGVMIASVLYPAFGRYLPGVLKTRNFSYSRLVEAFYYQTNGVLGLQLDVVVSMVSVFIILGICFRLSGTSAYLGDFALAILGRSRGGPAKVAILASAALGSMTGSAAANVSTTGVLTIPLMKKIGYPPHFAAAVEAVASTGSVMAPPVMGAAAFLMAEYLSIPYANIMIAAIVPTCMYYLGLYSQVHFAAIGYHLEGIRKEDLPSLRASWRVSYMLGFPIAVLVFCFLQLQQEPGVAGGIAVFSIIVISYTSRATMLTPRKVLNALRDSVDPLLQMVVICAGAGFVVGAMVMTNLGTTIARVVHAIPGGFMLPALILIAVAAIVLGMGMPATPVYIILVFAAVPSLLQFGVDSLAAHMFVFYFGMMSFITPPICVAVYVACAIAKSSFLKTALVGVRLGFVGYLFPFIMVYYPDLLLHRGRTGSAGFGIALSGLFVVLSAIVISGPVFRPLVRGMALVGALASCFWVVQL